EELRFMADGIRDRQFDLAEIDHAIFDLVRTHWNALHGWQASRHWLALEGTDEPTSGNRRQGSVRGSSMSPRPIRWRPRARMRRRTDWQGGTDSPRCRLILAGDRESAPAQSVMTVHRT